MLFLALLLQKTTAITIDCPATLVSKNVSHPVTKETPSNLEQPTQPRSGTLRQAPPGCRLPPLVVRHSAELPLIYASFTALNIEPSPQGDMRCNGSEYTSPSKVGIHITGWKSCNGWQLWKYDDQDTKDWKFISALRA